jgi:acetyl esterase/lipase
VNVDDAEKASLAQQSCTGDIIMNTTRPLDEIFRSDPANSATWQEAAHVNCATVGDSTVPVWVSHSDTDPLVPVSGTVAFVNELCAKDVPTEFIRQPTGNHGTAFYDTIDQVDTWITDRIVGKPAPSNRP